MSLAQAERIPSATYRVQLHVGFTFDQLTAIVPYLHDLGISDCYCSPVFLSSPGSTHGYDVNDPRRLDPELGGPEGFRRLAAARRQHELGLLLDFVPNHMGISGPFNPWWQDVLEGGPQSRYARFFDIQWNPQGSQLRERVLVPLLEDHYGAVLERGLLTLRYERGSFAVCYGEARFPVRPRTYAALLEGVAADAAVAPVQQQLLALADEFRRRTVAGQAATNAQEPRGEAMAALKQRLAALVEKSAGLPDAIEAHLHALQGTPGNSWSFDALDELIDDQHYRLARWRTGAHDINYRRFFAIDTLIGLRMENAEVFLESHRLLGALLASGDVTGVRIDHIDGLWDPQQYLERLQNLARPDGAAAARPLYVVVEKILAAGEQLPPTWPAHGTTGYEFITQLAQLFTDPAAAAELTGIYADFSGIRTPFDELVYEKKRLVLEEMFPNAVENLAANLDLALVSDRRWRDLTRHELMIAVRELMACLGVYRTYRRPDEAIRPEDRRVLDRALEQVLARNPRLNAEAVHFVHAVLTGDFPPATAPSTYRARLLHWTLTFQQYTGAVMAKSVEDTAFFVYCRLLALNEVGGEPARFGGTLEEFHAANRVRRDVAPHGLLATSTHDTKVSDDVRARLYALSEIPDEWRTWLNEWRTLNAPAKQLVDGRAAPDANEEYELYQILLGAWPLDDALPDDALRQRIRAHMHKAVNEAKLNTTWAKPNEPWLAACDQFINTILDPERGAGFLASFRPKAARLAHLGMVNSLAQLALKITAPGVPDVYQGCETWDFSLVDPDNRRPVDFDARRALLGGLAQRAPRDLLRDWRDGGIKLQVARTLLRFRREQRQLFAAGDYTALATRGRFADRVVAFARTHGPQRICVLVPRLTARLGCPPLGLVWDDTSVELGGGGPWRDLLTGRVIAPSAPLALAEAFAELPLAVLVSVSRDAPAAA